MSSQATKLVFVLLTLAAVVNAAVLRAVGLHPAMLQERSIFSFRDTKVGYDSLNNDYFGSEYSPYFDSPPPLEAYQKYPETYFYDGKPVLQAKYGVGLSQKKLKEMYKQFGGAYVTDHRGENPIAIGTSLKPPAKDEGLIKYLKDRDFVRTNFGRNAALAAYGHDAKPLKVSKWTWNPFRSTEPDVTSETSLRNMRYRLNNGRSINVSNKKGSTFIISKDILGKNMELDVWGELKGDFSKLSKVRF
ncbi:uncharacterized protein UTRI_04539_B [Ustilago trichophora]|uniref:Effector family protein Eff1 n=1 Tax=Ustilago trichophora TaxID=86804 RepID=A0A5C3EG45_9BASI|nr:uncharacterized protein UTRI_04539_B [Ustilago trichophora]